MIWSDEDMFGSPGARSTRVDLLAGTVYGTPAMSDSPQTVLVFDSGLGGLTVLSELQSALAGARFIYAADDAGFPYGGLPEAALIERVAAVMERLVAIHRPDLVVIACNTASTLVMPMLRSRFAVPFVGTVPAIKPAAAATRTGHVAVLATPGTVRRDYTRALIETYAANVTITLVGATRLAGLAEAHLKGEAVADEDILAEIGPCFVEASGARTDVVVLACTHYPLLVSLFRRVAPWPVVWLDPAPAIARRAAALLGTVRRGAPAAEAVVVFTGRNDVGAPLRSALSARGLERLDLLSIPLGRHQPAHRRAGRPKPSLTA